MRVAKIDHYKDDAKIKTLNIEKPISIPYLPVISNEKQRDKMVKTIEKYIRTSLEYTDMIAFLKEKIDMTHCTFFHNIGGAKKKGLIEIHHEPFDLYCLTSIVMRKHEHLRGHIDPLEVADEVMYLHYTGLVGLIPLAKTPHELVHAGKLIVPLNCVYGDFLKFTETYLPYLDDEDIFKLDQKIELTKKFRREDLSILNVRYVYVNVDGFNLYEVRENEE